MRTVVVQHTLVALVQDRPGVLNRAVSVFRRRGINIESLTVARTEQAGISRMTWIVTADDITSVIPQLEKLIDVLEVHEVRTMGAPPSATVTESSPAEPVPMISPSHMSAQADGVA